MLAGQPPDGWRTALEQALRHPEVVALAALRQVDLGNAAHRQALLAQAAAHLRQQGRPAEEREPLIPDGSTLTAYRLNEALRSYREIAAL